MQDKYPENNLNRLRGAILNDDEQRAKEEALALVGTFLLDIRRIADAAERLVALEATKNINPLMSGKDVPLPQEND